MFFFTFICDHFHQVRMFLTVSELPTTGPAQIPDPVPDFAMYSHKKVSCNAGVGCLLCNQINYVTFGDILDKNAMKLQNEILFAGDILKHSPILIYFRGRGRLEVILLLCTTAKKGIIFAIITLKTHVKSD